MSLPISHVTIFKKTGLVLWSRAVEKMRGDPVSQLIQNYLLEEKGGAARRATIDAYDLEWRFVNEGDLVVVVASQRSLELDFCGDLVDLVRKRVVASGAAADADKAAALRATFDATYDALAREMEAKLRLKRKKAAAKAEEARARREEQQAAKAAEEDDDDDESRRRRARPRPKHRASRSSSGARRRRTRAGGVAKARAEPLGPKKPTVWRDGSQRNKRLSAKEAEALDFSGKAGDADAGAAARRLDEMRGTYLPGRDETAAWDEADELVEESDDDGAEEKPAGWFGRSALGSLVANVSGTQTLTRELVDPAMEKLRTTLMEKNVAVEVADAITATVSESLVGKKVERLARAKTLVRDALKDAVARVLTPKRSTDVLREVLAAKKRPKGPYSIVFVGINGVGKSTSLSKVAYYLKEHGVDVMITACDTFRSGAVEQLRSHAKCLDVELYEKGYLKDPAARAGNNERLMRELAKLISVNSPDLVLFVGEALVGNDGIDQLNMFNKSLAQFCPDGRQIDGLVLSKFDTIDDKVGATP
ncbi:hypothetical protein JL721_5692 [Aureococcus anophagefferens]|nr:hypothetical protein JL721_5692 [Aureococcus anophagefferens]